MGDFITTDAAVIDPVAQAARVIGVAPDGTPIVSQVAMETLVIGPLSSDDPPTLLLPADPSRIRAKLQTDATFLALGESQSEANALNGWLMVFAYSGLIPEEMHTNGEVWGYVISTGDPDPATGFVRILVEKRVAS